ncbi:DUF2178 domain-containing protein [Domibacillus indicus]|uniref:DUF2178 domain-containing protein n=1 Tax=Domibacillus indicus TaxID=1437523 RepID=UPI000ABA66CD|nr:DUF2178 domain-containing protein [Domibacillus indicus]
MNNLIGLSGLAAGLLIAGIVYLINRRIGRKKRWFDERQKELSRKARAASWNITFGVLIIAWAVVIFVDGISFSFFLMTALYVAHCIGFLFTSIYYSQDH